MKALIYILLIALYGFLLFTGFLAGKEVFNGYSDTLPQAIYAGIVFLICHHFILRLLDKLEEGNS